MRTVVDQNHMLGDRARTALPYAAIVAVAALLMLPAFAAPVKLHDSFWIDWVWADQFTAQLREGVLYPRWLPQSHGGLGSPVFYYYPPLAFYVTGVFGLLGFSTYASILAAAFAALAASGAAMHLWLKGWARRPLLGAILFMAAPYHLLDFYGRGALAEFTAILFIPLVALGLRRVSEGRSGALLAISYAALTASHLPVALLVSLFFVGPYALYLARLKPPALLPFGGSLALGIGLAAIYLVPALALDAHRDAAQLWAREELRTGYWALLNPDWSHGMKTVIALLTAAIVLPALAAAAVQRSGWAAYALGICAISAGLAPGLWSLPLLESVQFPYRALPLAEFALATALASIAWTRLATSLTLFPAILLSFFYLTAPAPRAPRFSYDWMAANHPDVPEYLPRGARPYSVPSNWALETAERNPEPRSSGGVTVEPVFYFPAWRVRCAGGPAETFPSPEERLLSYRGANCERRLGVTAAEQIGAALSALSLALVLFLGLRRLRWRVRRARPGPDFRPDFA